MLHGRNRVELLLPFLSNLTRGVSRMSSLAVGSGRSFDEPLDGPQGEIRTPAQVLRRDESFHRPGDDVLKSIKVIV